MSRAQFWTIIGLFAALAGLMLETRYQDAVERANMRAEIQSLRAEMRDIRAEIGGLRGEIDGLRVEVDSKIDALRADIDTKIAALRAEMKSGIGGLRDAFASLNTRVSRMEGRLETVLREREEGVRVTRETVKAIVEEVLAERGL